MVETGPERPTYTSLARPPQETAPEVSRRRPVLPWLLAVVAIAFALGLLANPSFERAVRARIPGVANGDVSAAEAAELAALRSRLAVLEARPQPAPPRALNDPAVSDPVAEEQLAEVDSRVDTVAQAQAGLDPRVADLEAQVADLRRRIDTSVSAASDGAERAQTVLLVTAMRRAIDAGRRTDALEPALSARFGGSHPSETAALIAFGRAPVTAEQLRFDLERLRPTIEERVEASGDWWSSITRGLTAVVAVRRDDDPANPSVRIARASRRLAAGDVEGAFAQVAALPPAPRSAAAAWLSNARRHVVATQALARLEIAALTPVAPSAPPTRTTTL
jgi:hypothetical protein